MEIIYEQCATLEASLHKDSSDIQLNQRIYVSYHNKVHQDLSAILAENQSPDDKITQLEEYLVSNWQMIKGSLLCYTNTPDDPVTILMVSIAELIASNKKRVAAAVLMPNIKFKKHYGDKELGYTLPSSKNLTEIIRTHSAVGPYLLPVALLSEMNNGGLRNPFWDPCDEKTHKDHEISKQQLEALAEHSELSQAVHNNWGALQEIKNDESTLLGQLRGLVKNLYLNSAAMLGSEESAGSFGYSAIINCFSYYDKLNPASKDSLPQDLKDEVENLFKLSGDHEKNAANPMQTCLATRKQTLEPLVESNSEILSGITLGEPCKKDLIADAQTEFDKSKEALLRAIQRNEYSGSGGIRRITKTLLQELKIKFDTSNPSNARYIKELTDDTFKELFGDKGSTNIIIEQDFQQGISLYNFTMRLWNLSPTKIKIILQKATNIDKVVKNSQDFSGLMMLFASDLEKSEAIYAGLKDHLSDLIKYGHDFKSILEHLSETQRGVVFERFKGRLPAIIKNGHDFECVLKHLTETQRGVIFESIKGHLNTIIMYTSDFGHVLKHLTETQRGVVIESLKGPLHAIINNGHNFTNILVNLTEPERTVVIDSFENRLPAIIKNSRDFGYVIEHLTETQRTVVIDSLKGSLPKIIKGGYDFGCVVEHLTETQRTVVFDSLKGSLPNIIKGGSAFQCVVEHLTETQRGVVLESFKNRLPAIIKNCHDFRSVLKHLTETQRGVVFESFENRLPAVIKNGHDFEGVLKHLTETQRGVVFESFENRLPALIKNGYDFECVLKHLTETQRGVVFDCFKNRLPDIIKDGDDFKCVVEHLTKTQIDAVLNILKDHLVVQLNAISNSAITKRKNTLFSSTSDIKSNAFTEMVNVIQGAPPALYKELLNHASQTDIAKCRYNSQPSVETKMSQAFSTAAHITDDFIMDGFSASAYDATKGNHGFTFRFSGRIH